MLFLEVSRVDINTGAILLLLILILYFVSDVGKKLKRLGRSSYTYLNTQAKIKAIEYAPSGIVTIDSEGKVIAWNAGATTIFGFTEKDMMGSPLFRIIPERNRQRHIDGLKNAKNADKSSMVGKTLDLTGLKKDGKEVDVRLTLWRWMDGINTFYTGIIRDITLEKANENRITHLLEMYANAEEIDDSGVWSWDVLNDVVYTSKGYDKIYDIDDGNERNSAYFLRRIYHEDLDFVERTIKEIFEKKEEYTLVHRVVKKDGSVIRVQTNGKPRCNDKGELVAVIGTTHKIL